MQRIISAVFLSITFAVSAHASPDRPGWEKVDNGVRFPVRDVVASPGMPLPAVGEAFYVFTKSALTRDQIAVLADRGLRYLGVVAHMTYAFRRESASSQKALLKAQTNFIGTAIVQPRDRIEADLLPFYDKAELPHPIWVAMHPRTTAAELLALIPDAAERIRMPKTTDGRLQAESLLNLEIRNGAQMRRLSRSPFVVGMGMIHPKKTMNAASRALSNANSIIAAPYNLDGTDVVVGHWDGGRVASGHNDFGGRVTNYENGGVSSHATHTAGTILGDANNTDAKGYAPEATMVAYDFYGNATAERRAAKHDHYHEHDNHSWGSTSSAYGGYDDGARSFDLDSRDLFLIGLKAAGNEGRSNQVVDQNYGFDSLPPDSTSKNVLIVCATDDAGDLASFSSRGPTNDGRIKPDICGNGQNLYSTMPNGGHGNMSGTSMATPSVTGMVTLLSQLYKQEVGRRWAPDYLSALMLHTVTDVFHTGPDYRFGWGNADAKAAADLILADVGNPGQRLARGALRDGESVEYEMEVPAGSPEVKVTVAWQDATSGGTAQRRLINDLDLVLVSPSGESKYPWTLDPSNPFDDAVRTQRNELDNVEQVLVDNPEAGTWIVRMAAAGVTDPDLNVQGFVLATSHNLSRAFERIEADIPVGGLTAPDGDADGLELRFESADPRNVQSIRLRLEIHADARGDVRIEVTAPDGTSSAIETEDQSTRRDIYAVYPDTRSYAGDVDAMYGQPATGAWVVKVIDTDTGGAVVILDGMLEIEFDGTAPPPPNTTPVANAGKDETVEANEMVTLDGTDSADPDGDPLTFSWSQATGPTVTLTGADTETPTFEAPESLDTKTLVFRLTVDDGRGGSASDDVTITVIGTDPGPPNQPPEAITNGDQVVKPGIEVTLDASASTDPDGDPLTFRWTQVSGEPIVLSDNTAAAATFLSPAAPAELLFRVEVEDGRGGIDLEDVTITVDEKAPDPVEPPPAEVTNVVLNNKIGGGCACSAREVDATSGFGMLLIVVGLLALRRRR